MKDTVDLKVGPDGSVVGIYDDGLAEALGAEVKGVTRASNVEWEVDGWTVRSAVDQSLALRDVGGVVRPARHGCGPVVTFPTREAALAAEIANFWQLIERS
jgi:hypothetical protein